MSNEIKRKISIDELETVYVLSIFHQGNYNYHETLWLVDTLTEAYEYQCKDFFDRLGKDEIKEHHGAFLDNFMKEDYKAAVNNISSYDNLPFYYQIEDFT